jgi:hypothetical protein
LGAWRVLAFIEAKCDEHVIALDILNPQSMFKIVLVKWRKISAIIMAA